MRFTLVIVMLCLSQLAFGQSLKDKRIKEEMLERTDSLITKASETREFLKAEDPESACVKINEMFRIIPDHLVSIGTRMNLLDSDVIKMEQETKMFLIYIHQRSNICAQGEKGENLDLKETDGKMKSMGKKLAKQKKKINKLKTTYNNTYNYYYEFN